MFLKTPNTKTLFVCSTLYVLTAITKLCTTIKLYAVSKVNNLHMKKDEIDYFSAPLSKQALLFSCPRILWQYF